MVLLHPLRRTLTLVLVASLLADPALCAGFPAPALRPVNSTLFTEQALVASVRHVLPSLSRSAGIAEMHEEAKMARLTYPRPTGQWGNPGRLLDMREEEWKNITRTDIISLQRIRGAQNSAVLKQALRQIATGRAFEGQGRRRAEFLMDLYQIRYGNADLSSLTRLHPSDKREAWVMALDHSGKVRVVPRAEFVQLFSFFRYENKLLLDGPPEAQAERNVIRLAVTSALTILGVGVYSLPKFFNLELRLREHDVDEEVDLWPGYGVSDFPTLILRRAVLDYDHQDLLERLVYGLNHLVHRDFHTTDISDPEYLSDEQADAMSFVKFVAHVGWTALVSSYRQILASGVQWELANRVLRLSQDEVFTEAMTRFAADFKGQAHYIETYHLGLGRTPLSYLFNGLYQAMTHLGQINHTMAAATVDGIEDRERLTFPRSAPSTQALLIRDIREFRDKLRTPDTFEWDKAAALRKFSRTSIRHVQEVLRQKPWEARKPLRTTRTTARKWDMAHANLTVLSLQMLNALGQSPRKNPFTLAITKEFQAAIDDLNAAYPTASAALSMDDLFVTLALSAHSVDEPELWRLSRQLERLPGEFGTDAVAYQALHQAMHMRKDFGDKEGIDLDLLKDRLATLLPLLSTALSSETRRRVETAVVSSLLTISELRKSLRLDIKAHHVQLNRINNQFQAVDRRALRRAILNVWDRERGLAYPLYTLVFSMGDVVFRLEAKDSPADILFHPETESHQAILRSHYESENDLPPMRGYHVSPHDTDVTYQLLLNDFDGEDGPEGLESPVQIALKNELHDFRAKLRTPETFVWNKKESRYPMSYAFQLHVEDVIDSRPWYKRATFTHPSHAAHGYLVFLSLQMLNALAESPEKDLFDVSIMDEFQAAIDDLNAAFPTDAASISINDLFVTLSLTAQVNNEQELRRLSHPLERLPGKFGMEAAAYQLLHQAMHSRRHIDETEIVDLQLIEDRLAFLLPRLKDNLDSDARKLVEASIVSSLVTVNEMLKSQRKQTVFHRADLQRIYSQFQSADRALLRASIQNVWERERGLAYPLYRLVFAFGDTAFGLKSSFSPFEILFNPDRHQGDLRNRYEGPMLGVFGDHLSPLGTDETYQNLLKELDGDDYPRPLRGAA